MPFCTECGHLNPDDARFCSQCGRRIVTEAAPAAAGDAETPSETTATITFGAPGKPELAEERAALNEADAAAVDALPAGSALLVVQRGPSAGAGSCSTPTWSPPGGTRRARSSSTTSPSPAGTRSSAAAPTATGWPTSAASTGPT